MRLIVGLGNPGAQYERNRHNIGFMAVDEIYRRNSGFSPWRPRFQALVSEGQLGSEKVMLMKPTTYMNESGRAVGEAARFYKLEPSDILVIYDEMDLAPGKFRIKVGGGHGGHNGIRSIKAHIDGDFRRLRLGIGHPGDKSLVTNYVLGNFSKADEADWMTPLFQEIADHADMLAAGQDSQFANKLTLALNPEKDGHKAAVSKQTRKQTASSTTAVAAASPKPKGQSHIRQARQPNTPKMPTSGPMADMLKKMFGKKDEN